MSDIARTSERLELVPKNCSSYTTENKTNKNTLKSLFWWWWSDCVYFRTNVRSEALLYDWKQNKTEIHISISRSIISVPSLLLLRILLKVIICCCNCCYYCSHCRRRFWRALLKAFAESPTYVTHQVKLTYWPFVHVIKSRKLLRILHTKHIKSRSKVESRWWRTTTHS